MPNPSDVKNQWLIFYEQKLLLYRSSQSLLPSEPILADNFSRSFPLGQHLNSFCYCAELQNPIDLPQDLEFLPLRHAFERLGKDWYTVIAKAVSILNWDLNHQFCGRCGAATYHKIGVYERNCTNCDLSFYPRISPSIIVLISRGEEILMARSPHFKPGSYGLIAGYVESGESVEATVHREVMEEVGIKIKNLKYFSSQSWPFPDSLMIGFTAEHAEGEIVIDEIEIEAAGWYHYEHLPGRPSTNISIASRLIEYFCDEQNKLKGLK